eukprot:gene51226-14448_t
MLHNIEFTTDDGDPIIIFVDHPAGARATKQLCTAVCSDKSKLDTYRAEAIARLTSGRQIQEPTEDVLLQQLRTTTDGLPDGRTKNKQKWAEAQVKHHLATLGLSNLDWHRGKHKGAGHKAAQTGVGMV